MFSVYAVVLTGLIYFNRFFSVFKDDKLKTRTLTAVFILKVLAVPAFYAFFTFAYGGIESVDAGYFYADAKTINNLAYIDFKEYLKMLVGLQDDTPGSFFSKTCIETTHNWDNGVIKDFFYNDNRVVIRIHSIVHFIAFGSYYVHALFSSFISFVGLFYIYKALKTYFKNKEKWLFVLICLYPTLWLHTGGLLKEGPVVFTLGCLLFQLRIIFSGKGGIRNYVYLIVLIFISVLLKPYVLLFGAGYFFLFFLTNRFVANFKLAVFLFLFGVMVVSGNYLSKPIKGRTLVEAAKKREAEFANMCEGGIFLLDSVKFVRLEYDTSLVKRVKGKQDRFTIKENVPYVFWEHTHQQDKLTCKANKDTVTRFSLVYRLTRAGSYINVIRNTSNWGIMITRSLYYSSFYPLFFNANGLLQQLASFENLVLIISLIIVITGTCLNYRNSFPGIIFALYGLSVFILVGFTTPNSGAIFRYRAPAAIFIIMAALYFIPSQKLKRRQSK